MKNSFPDYSGRILLFIESNTEICVLIIAIKTECRSYNFQFWTQKDNEPREKQIQDRYSGYVQRL